MVTNEQLRMMALALPEAYEEGHWDAASFRVRKRIFAVLHAHERRVVLKLNRDYQESLVALDPAIYSLGGWSHQGWTDVSLKSVPKADLQEHLVAAWREVAPKRVIKTYDEGA
jgi:hypothetical protein